ANHMSWFADAMIVISGYLRAKFERIADGRFPVYLVPVSVDLHRIHASGRPFHRPVRIFYAGSFAEKDGVENLIAAFEQVAVKHDVELLLTGRGMQERMRVL